MKQFLIASFRGSYVRESELSHVNLVNRIIKNNSCTQFAREDVGLCHFYNFARERTHIVYEITLLKRLLQITSFSNISNKIMHHLMLRMIPYHHYFTSNRIVKLPKYWFLLMLFHSIKQSANYFVNWLLPRLFANVKDTHLYLVTGQVKYVLITFITANMYQISLHLSWRNVNLKVC